MGRRTRDGRSDHGGFQKVYGEDVVAVRDVNLDITDGEFIVFVGPSGCGKSTALRVITGLEDISSGKVFIRDNIINDLPPLDRDIAWSSRTTLCTRT